MSVFWKKILILNLFILILCLTLTSSQTASASSDVQAPEITAKAAILMEAATGRVIYEKNSKERRYPASTTKIMTLITALEYGNLEDIVTASKNATSTEGSSLDLREGEKVKMLDMLYGLVMISGNDASVAIAEHISGSMEAFASLMTQKANSIGAFDTNFVNSSGLPDERHYSTAYDLACMAAYGYKNPLFAHIISTNQITIAREGKNEKIRSENKILNLYEGGNGVKTGYTKAAGRCFVAGAKRHNTQLIAVVLESKDIWKDSRALLDYGFNEAKLVNVIRRGDILKTLSVKDGKDKKIQLVTKQEVSVPLVKAEYISSFVTQIDAPEKVAAPILSGQKVGTVKLIYENNEIAAADLVASKNIERKSFFFLIWDFVQNLYSVFTSKSSAKYFG